MSTRKTQIYINKKENFLLFDDIFSFFRKSLPFWQKKADFFVFRRDFVTAR